LRCSLFGLLQSDSLCERAGCATPTGALAAALGLMLSMAWVLAESWWKNNNAGNQ